MEAWTHLNKNLWIMDLSFQIYENKMYYNIFICYGHFFGNVILQGDLYRNVNQYFIRHGKKLKGAFTAVQSGKNIPE